MGNTGTALQGIGSLTSNPAGLSSLKTAQVGSYYQSSFLNNDIRTIGAVLALPTALGVFGVQFSNYGVSRLYADIKASLVFSRSFGSKLAVGTAFNYHQLQINRYGTSKAYSVDLGVQYMFTPQWIIGAHVANFGNASYDETAQAIIPVYCRLGTSYRVHDRLLFSADAEQLFYGQHVDFRTGIEYGISRQFYFRGGLAFHEIKQFFGFGLQIKGLSCDFATMVHPRLGLSPQLFVAYAF